jgi:hypothetical protein
LRPGPGIPFGSERNPFAYRVFEISMKSFETCLIPARGAVDAFPDDWD